MSASTGTSGVSCRLCGELFDVFDHEPRVMDCLHTFCAACLSKLSVSPNGQVHCPVDGRPTFAATNEMGLPQFKKNYRLIEHLVMGHEGMMGMGSPSPTPLDGVAPQLQDVLLRRTAGGGDAGRCDRSKCMERGVSATKWCMDCKKAMCDRCDSHHAELFENRHTVVHISKRGSLLLLERGAMASEERCEWRECEIEEHRGHLLQLVCIKCRVPVCSLCAAVQHKGHECVVLSSVSAKLRTDILWLCELLRRREGELAARVKDDALMLDSTRRTATNSRTAVESSFTSLEEELIKKWTEMKGDYHRAVQASQETMKEKELALIGLDEAILFTSSLLRRTQEAEFAQWTGKVHRRIQKLLAAPLEQVAPPTLDMMEVEKTMDLLVQQVAAIPPVTIDIQSRTPVLPFIPLSRLLSPKPLATGELYLWGNNTRGQIGFSDTNNRIKPQNLEVFQRQGKKIQLFKFGEYHTAVTLDTGEMFIWGENSYGQLGLGHTKNRPTPQQVNTLKDNVIVGLGCGEYHTVVVLDTGDLYAWGYNAQGTLGLADSANRPVPTLVPFFHNPARRVAKIACGGNHSIALLSSGDLYSWGDNSYGQLGIGDNVNKNSPQLALKKDKLAVQNIVCGYQFTYVLLENNRLLVSGHNSSGELGLGDTQHRNIFTPLTVFESEPPITNLSCGFSHAALVLAHDELFVWGNNNHGQLGIPGRMHSFPQQMELFDGTRIATISCGAWHTIILLESGELFSWGCGGQGRLGTGDELNRDSPQKVNYFQNLGKPVVDVVCGSTHSMALIGNFPISQ